MTHAVADHATASPQLVDKINLNLAMRSLLLAVVGAFIVTRRWPGLLVLNFWIVQLCGLAVAQWRQQLRLVALLYGIVKRNFLGDEAV